MTNASALRPNVEVTLGKLEFDSIIMANMMLDSEPVFTSRMKGTGVSPAAIVALRAAGINTLSRLAFAVSCQPGVGDEKPFIDLMELALGVSPIAPGELASLRRCWFEASTVAVAEMRSRVDRTDESRPKKLPQPERTARRSAQALRLSGLQIEGALEPSHALIDLVVQMCEDEILRYVDPSVCTARQAEILGVKKEQFMKQTANGALMGVEREVVQVADLTTEFRVRTALQRRSLALDQVGILDYARSERYHSYLFALIMKPIPETHFAINLAQVLTADKHIWAFMGEECRDGITARTNGSQPVEEALRLALLDPVIMSLLQPLPRGGGGKGRNQGKANDAEEQGDAKKAKKGGGKGGSGKQAAKAGIAGSGAGAKAGAAKKQPWSPMPKSLIGHHAQTAAGERICFGCNLPGGCPNAQFGSKCPRGMHCCCKCLDSGHGFQTCPK